MKKKNMIRLLVAMVVAYVIMHLATYQIGDVREKEYQIVDEYLTTNVLRSDSSYEQYDTNKFPVANQGDIVVGTLSLPKELEIQNAGIGFRISNCWIRILYKGTLLYSYGEEQYKNKKMIGAVYVKVQVPQEAWGENLEIVCTASENEAFSTIAQVAVMKAQDLGRNSIIHRELGFMMYITMFIISCIMLLYFIINGHYDSMVRQGIYLSAFGICASVWIISYTGIYTVFSSNMRMYSSAEYIAFFLIPIPFLSYLLEQQRGQRSEWILQFWIVIFAIFFVVATILNYTVPSMHYTRMVKYFHIIMMLASIMVIHICRKSKSTLKRDKYMILTGLCISIVLFLADIASYNINKFTQINMTDRKYVYSELGIAIFLATMLLGYEIRMIDFFRSRKEKKHLEELAYMDRMTKLANRAGCFVMMNWLDQKENHTYQVIYMDVNCLKNTNDRLGHEVGDQLITQVAELIRDCFGASEFCGRLGGDEFIIIIEQKSKWKVQKMLNHFESELKKFNANRGKLFRISVSYGMERHEKDDTRTAEEIIRVADSKMYSEKKLGKQ